MAQAIAMDVLAFYMDFLAGSKHQKQDFCDLEVRDTVRAPPHRWACCEDRQTGSTASHAFG
jgi:hypothetical protein